MTSEPADGGVNGAGAPAPVLVEPARQQLLQLADDVLGRLAADDVPPPLRPIARFTPSKRLRLGATALAAALDADDDFRGRVAEAAATGSPGLAAAVADGTSTAASDPADVAVMVYLTRPDGWHDLLAGAAARWDAGRPAAPSSAPSVELDALREEVATLRSTVRGEAARLRAATADALADTAAEVTSLRRTVRERTRELRAAERARDEARAAADEVDERIARLEAVQETELKRLRGRVAESDRSAEAARRGARTERDVDDARLWLLVDTLVQAASGVRRELSLAAPSVRPADTVTAAGAAPGMSSTRTAVNPAALDGLLALPHVHLVIDGYNVTKTGYPELTLADQRQRLVGGLASLVARSGIEVTVAFDGAARPPFQAPTPRGVRVLFSAADEIADDLIRRLVAAEPPGRPVIVVTSDRAIVTDVARAGMWTVASDVLVARLS